LGLVYPGAILEKMHQLNKNIFCVVKLKFHYANFLWMMCVMVIGDVSGSWQLVSVKSQTWIMYFWGFKWSWHVKVVLKGLLKSQRLGLFVSF